MKKAGTDVVTSKIQDARRLLAEVRDIPSAKQVVDMAHAAEVYSRRQKLSREAVNDAHAIMVDAQLLLGKMLQEMPKNKGLNGSVVVTGSKREPVKDATPTLADAGLTKKDSARAQKVARIAAAGNGLFEELRSNQKTVAQAEREIQRQQKRKELASKAQAARDDGRRRWRIEEGDCLNILPTLAAVQPRLAFADTQYNEGVDYGEGMAADLLPPDEYLAWCRAWMAECCRLLAPDGSFWVLINHEWENEFGMLLKYEMKLTIRSFITWYETFGVNCTNNFNRCSRRLFYCVKNPKHFVFNAEAVNRLSDRQAKYNDARADPAGKLWDDVWKIPRLVDNAKERIPDFPTQLPLALVEPIVLCSSNPGDLVLDPFNGSGTTGLAAIRNARHYIGIEKSSTYVKLARQRLSAECPSATP
jgi:site-specific DNA-methyltransferase (adenine-specific)